MQCRSECGACCIAPSFSKSLKGLPDGKPAGIPCIHLTADFLCALWNSADRPDFCTVFKPEPDFCGDNSIQALNILADLEESTR